MFRLENNPIRLSLSVEFVRHSAVFFSHNESTNSTFSHDFSASEQMSLSFTHTALLFLSIGFHYSLFLGLACSVREIFWILLP
jgi:hypothetical protein